MKPEKPPFESVPPKSHYDQTLLETREKCLPLLERLVGKFSEYKKICTALKEKRPPLEWLIKLDATCEKIQKKMTAQFFEKLDEAEKESRNNAITTLEKANNEIVSDRDQAGNWINTQRRSRWDVKPTDDIQKDEKPIPEKDIPKNDEIRISKTSPAYEDRHTTEKGLSVIDLTKNEDVEKLLCKEETPRSQLKEIRAQDLDVEIIASTAGYNPLRRAKSQTQFVTLEEVNKSPFYKKFTSDNMVLDSRTANLKYGTVFDLVKSKAQSSETRHRRYSQRRCEDLSRRQSERNESWSHRRDYENNKCPMNSFDKKTSLSRNKSQVSNLGSDKTYDHLQSAVNFFERNNESNAVTNPRWSDDSSSKIKYGKSGNDFQGKIPFYKQNIAGNSRYSYPEKSFTTNQPSKDPVLPSHHDLYPASSKSFPSNQSVTNAQFNSVGYPQQACSFHCNCCKNTPYFSRMGALYQPTATSVVGNSNYAFFSGQFFPNQPVISPPNKNLPTPFPTYAVPPLPTALPASTPYSNVNKPGYSVPVFCNEGRTSINKTNPSLMSWHTSNTHHPELTCRNIAENSSRSKDPRADIIKDRLTHSTSNITQRHTTIDPALTKSPCFSGISEERFSQSCTFLRPDNLYTDFKCHSDDCHNNSFESLKSFGLISNVTTGNVPSKIDLLNKSTISNSNNFSNIEVNCKINHSQGNNCNGNSHNLQSEYETDKQEETVIIQDCKTQKPHDNYISPLSNLYNDCNPKFEGYTNLTIKQLENRKRKYDDSIERNFSCGDNKRKSVGKVKPMTKLCHNENKESLISKNKQNSENNSTLKNHEINENSRVENSPRSDETNLSVEHREIIKSPIDWVDKDCRPISYQSSTKEINSERNETPLLELFHSENSLVSEKENSFGREKMLEKGVAFKKLKEPHDSTTNQSNQSNPSRNIQIHEKEKTTGKYNLLQSRISSQKTDTKKIESNCSHSVQSQLCEKVSVTQKEKLDCKAKDVKKVSSSKNIDRNPEPNTNFIVQHSENNPVVQKGKSVDKEKLPEKNITSNRSISDKKKCTTAQTHQKDKSTEKEICLRKNGSFNKPLTSKNQDNNKMSTELKETTSSAKDKCSGTFTSVISKNKDNYKTSTLQKSKILNDNEKRSEEPTSVVSKNKDNYKATTPQKGKALNNQEKSSEKPSVVNKNKDNHKTSTPQEGKTLNDQEKSFEKPTSVVSKSKDNYKTSTPQDKEGKPSSDKEKSSVKLKCSKKPIKINNKISLNKVITQKENSDMAEECLTNNSMPRNVDTNINTGSKTLSQGTTSNSMEKCQDKKTSSRKRNIGEIKDCRVVLKREESMVIEKSISNNVHIEKSASKPFVGNIPSPDKVQLHDLNMFEEKDTVSHTQVTSNSKCTEKTVISEKEKTLEIGKNGSKEISNFDNEKVKDLVLRMKSLSQFEALKVLTEFASALKVGKSQEKINLSKEQRVPSKEEVMEQTTGQIKIKDEIIDDGHEPDKIKNYVSNKVIDNSESVENTAKTVLYNTQNNNTISSQSAKQSSKTFERQQNKIKLTLQDSGANVNKTITEFKICEAPLNKVTETTSEKLSKKVIPANIVNKHQSEKYKFSKKKKLSELDKIHADLESCHGLDDIMKCSGVRSCRLRTELGGALKENTTEDRQIKKRRVTESPEESFFIEDEITIKMEPIPELTFDFIKQEPEYY